MPANSSWALKIPAHPTARNWELQVKCRGTCQPMEQDTFSQKDLQTRARWGTEGRSAMWVLLEHSWFHSSSATECRGLGCSIPTAPSRREFSVSVMFQPPASFPLSRACTMVSQPRGWQQAPGPSHDCGHLQGGSLLRHRSGTQQPHSPPPQRQNVVVPATRVIN